MSTKSTALVTRAGRGKNAPVSITPAGLALVEELAGEGQDFRSIAKRLGINHQTFNVLRKKDEALAEAVERGQAVLADEVTHLLLKSARKGNVVAAIFLAKARLGWTDAPAQTAGGRRADQPSRCDGRGGLHPHGRDGGEGGGR